ncbi:hypothetical protein F4778DRAFT_679313 [Xylariomycetidae sp. FL2044]|nr:hypothetical protein F4778DRAFT_679313 [Xylariomycetidae sp. FL2044]
MADERFRAIIIGAGPVGLYLGHALSAASIDFVILEQQHAVVRSTANESSHIISILPQNARLFDQIGIYDDVMRRAIPFNAKTKLSSDGRLLTNMPVGETLKKEFGYTPPVLHRMALLAALYERLPSKASVVKTGAEVLRIESDESSVSVFLRDGTVEHGSIVIGADGAHSQTRQAIRKQVGETQAADDDTMVATYGCLLFRAPQDFGLRHGHLYETSGPGVACQSLAYRDFFGGALFKRLPAPTTARHKYSAEETEELAASMMDAYVGPGIKFRDVWAHVDKSALRFVNLEEGMAKTWHHGRLVLVGDSAVKMTNVNGANCGLQCAAVLASELQRLVSSSGPSPGPSTEALRGAFARYQSIRFDEARVVHALGYRMTRTITWDNWLYWLLDWVVNRWVKPETLQGAWIRSMRSGRVLDYVPFQGKQGQTPWINFPAEVKKL